VAQPFLKRNCLACHQGDYAMAGIRIDLLNGKMEERHLDTWEAAFARISGGSMPPAGAPQPSVTERKRMADWIDHALEAVRARPAVRNGMVRRLTVAQYRNTLRDLLQLDDEVANVLPPDAVSKEGFLNNQDRLELSPLLTETYFEIADRALSRVITDPARKPSIENFSVDFGAGINHDPLRDRLILGAGSNLLAPEHFTVSQLTAKKQFPFEPFFMRTKFRFVEGYVGNATVRGWLDFDSIYHAVFADFRGSDGYPKGRAYDPVPEGLLLRPAIPGESPTGDEGFGPKANLKIAVRELPDDGRFRITVTAAKYDDGLLLDKDASAKPETALGAIVIAGTTGTAAIARPGVYQVDIYAAAADPLPAPDASRLSENLAGEWNLDGPNPAWKLVGETQYTATPFGKGVHYGSEVDAVAIPYSDALNVGSGDFTISGWVKTGARLGGIVSASGLRSPGWYVETNERGGLQFSYASVDGKTHGQIVSQNGVMRGGTWQNVAVVAGRGPDQTRIYVNGVLVGRGTTPPADLTYRGDILIGDSPGVESYLGDLDEFRLYKRALTQAEVRALAAPKVELPPPTRNAAPRLPEVALSIGARQFSGNLQQPAFLVVRLEAGAQPVSVTLDTLQHAGKIVLTPLAETSAEFKRFAAFEKRFPKVGVHLGFRRDCGSSLIPVGAPQPVPGTNLQRYVFEGAMRNFPNPEVEPNNVNYLAGVREIGVRSEYTDGRDMPRLLIRSVEFEGPLLDQWPPAPHKNIFLESRRKADQPAYAREIIRRFATRAFRRPISTEEENALYAVYKTSAASGRKFEDGVKDALMVTLTSPQFLFLVENSATSGSEPLDDYELASKLSYFLWNSPPDRRTLQLAASKTLRKQLDAEVTRMLADPKSSRFLSEFVPQWLSLDKFQVLEPDRRRFPKLIRATRAQLIQEPVEFVRYLIANNLPMSNLVQSDFVVANEPVAGYYDLGSETESGFNFVAIANKRQDLGGLLTQAAVMAGLSDGRESNPVKRGAWLARKIIAEPPPNPPPNVPALPEDSGNLTLRQRLEQHRNVATCRSCHSKIDPWGIAMEEFDAGGRLKTQPTDASTTLPNGTEIAGASDLKRYLSGPRMDQVAFSVLKHLTTYASGRSLSYAELNLLKRDGTKLKAGDYRMQDAIRYVVNSPLFLEK
ncbi:MAG: DUF1592 domain-containing protein, partial [Bryobacteraceae bacterium]